jgi:hypothetical protein
MQPDNLGNDDDLVQDNIFIDNGHQQNEQNQLLQNNQEESKSE